MSMAKAKAKQGDTVHVHYTGRFEDGTVFDTSEGRSPLEFTLGSGQVIPGFERAVEGLAEGDETVAEIPPEEAYGPGSEQLVMEVERSRFPEGVSPAVGQQFTMTTEDGQQVPVTVTSAETDRVEIDANHPLAGRQLNFHLELVKIG
jgi:FKBP-type peptidyl-prolyl cis-trans isomerase 2